MLDRDPQAPRADRFLRWAAGAAVLLLAFYVAQPTINGFLFAAEDRARLRRGGNSPPSKPRPSTSSPVPAPRWSTSSRRGPPRGGR